MSVTEITIKLICIICRLDVHPTTYEYHNVHEEQQHHNIHDTHSNEDIVYGQQHHESESDHSSLQTNENFPSDKHTQVYFKTTTETPYQSEHYGHEQQPQQYLPQSHVNMYRAPLVYHKLEQFYNVHDDHGDQGDTSQYSGHSG